MTEPSRALWSDRTNQKSELKGQNGHLATNKWLKQAGGYCWRTFGGGFLCAVGFTGGVAVSLDDVARPSNMIGLTLGQPGHPTTSTNRAWAGTTCAGERSYGWFQIYQTIWTVDWGPIILHVSATFEFIWVLLGILWVVRCIQLLGWLLKCPLHSDLALALMMALKENTFFFFDTNSSKK